MPKRIDLTSIRDFTGGLNLRADSFQLDINESPDLLNVDVDPRGGFRLRKAVKPFVAGSNGFTSPVNSAFQFSTVGGVRHVLVGTGGMIYSSSGGAWAAVNGALGVRNGPHRFAVFKDTVYIQNGTNAPIRWNGVAAATTLTQSWAPNYEVPGSGNMPIGRTITPFMGSLMVANTLEGGSRFPNRLRFSHPNQPESWRAEDFIDVDPGVDGDEITALVPFSDHLLIFKKHSIYALYGDGPENYRVFPVSPEVGAISQEAVVVSDYGVYFFSWPEGVFIYDGRRTNWLFERIYPALADGTIPHYSQSQIVLGWGNRRLWVGVPWNGALERNRTFVLDPTLGKEGAWVAYDLGLGPFLEWDPPGNDALMLAGAKNTVVRLDQDGTTDQFHTGTADVPIRGYYRTKFIDLDQPAVKKKWKRPEIVLRAGTDIEVAIKVFRDYDPSHAVREFAINLPETQEVGEAGDDPTYRWEANWDSEFKWARGGGASGGDREHNEVHKGSQLGTARSVSLSFEATGKDWGVNSVVFKYVPRPVRS